MKIVEVHFVASLLQCFSSTRVWYLLFKECSESMHVYYCLYLIEVVIVHDEGLTLGRESFAMF